MKAKYFIPIFFFFSFAMSAQQEHYYYYKGNKFYLSIDYSRISVISNGKISVDADKALTLPSFKINNEVKSYTQQNVIPVSKSSNVQTEGIYISEIEFDNLLKETEYYKVIQSITQKDDVIKVLPTYTVFNKKLGASNNFYVKLFKEEDKNKLFDLAKQYSIQILGYNKFMPLWFTLSCTKQTAFSPIEVANLFHESQLFENAEPEFLYHDLSTSNDEYFPNQWGLKNTGQHCSTSNIDIRAENAWSVTIGDPNIRVAVFDHGIKMDHPDLINNIYGDGYDAQTNTTPSIVRGFHGTTCAGIISAQQNNSIGISGVSPNSKLISISINLDWGDTPQQLANGFNWAWQNGADIISNSWGGYAPSSIIE